MSGTKVYVGDLGSGGSKPELEREFEKFGVLKSVWVARNPPGSNMCMCLVRSSIEGGLWAVLPFKSLPLTGCACMLEKAGVLCVWVFNSTFEK
jgi:RNA recognition motif-containing protein